MVNIGFSLDVGEDKVECSFEDIKWTGRESILAETRTRKETIENRKNFFNYEFLFLVVETKYLMLNFVE